MGVRVGNVLIATAAEIGEGPAGKDVAEWDVAGIAVRGLTRTDIYMMNAVDAKAIIALLQKAIDEAPEDLVE